MNVFLVMTERMSSDLWRVHKWNQNLIFQNLQKVEKNNPKCLWSNGNDNQSKKQLKDLISKIK